MNMMDNNLNLEIYDRTGLSVRTATFPVIGHVHKPCHLLRPHPMKKIPLTKGQFALVDDNDFEMLSLHKWCASPTRDVYCAARSVAISKNKRGLIYMHREILNPPFGMAVDHINHDKLDNRRKNLRVCTVAQNNQNRRKFKKGSSQYKGVFWNKWNGKWQAQIGFNGDQFYLGYFKEEEAAAKAYDLKARELFGRFALCNFNNGNSIGE